MMFSNATQEYRRVKCSKIGDFFSSVGSFSRAEVDVPTRTVHAPKVGEAPNGKGAAGGSQKFDQGFVDSNVERFPGHGHPSGSKLPGDEPGTPELADYKTKHQQEWRARRDVEIRDKLFEQPTTGRVEGLEVEPYSAHALETQAVELTKATTKFDLKTTLKAAAVNSAVGAPITVGVFVVAGNINESLKPIINPPAVTATQKSVEEGRLVDHLQSSVLLIANTLASQRGDAPVKPSVQWVAQTPDERLDSLEDILDYSEAEFAKQAQKHGIAHQLASTGLDSDDIKTRAVAMEARMAVLTALFGALKKKVSATIE